MATARENSALLPPKGAREPPVDLRAEFSALTNMALQVSLSTFARLALMSVDFAFLGHLGTTELAAASLSAVWTSVPLMTIWGSCGALTTLCGQAWGAKNGDLMGVWLQMGLVVVTVLMVPVSIWYWFIGSALESSTNDAEVVRLGVRFARILSFSIWPSLVYVCVRLYFQSMGIMAPTTVVGALSIGVAVGANYFLIYGCFGWSGLGFDGSPLATVIASWFQPIALIGYCIGYKKMHLQAWGGWDWNAFTPERMVTYMNLAVPIAINSLIANMASSGLSLIAAKLGSDVIAANAVVTGLWKLLWALFWGFGCATQIRVANCLGANRPKAALALSKLGLVCTVVCVLLLAGVTLALREYLFQLYTTDDDLLKLCMLVQPIFITGFIIESIELLAMSILNAMGEAKIVAWTGTISTWFIELPVAYFGSVTLGYGFPALWYSICIMELVKLAVFFVKLSRTDWNRMARNAVANMEMAQETEAELEEEALSVALAEGGNAPLGTNTTALAPLTPIPTPSSVSSNKRRQWGDDPENAAENGTGLHSDRVSANQQFAKTWEIRSYSSYPLWSFRIDIPGRVFFSHADNTSSDADAEAGDVFGRIKVSGSSTQTVGLFDVQFSLGTFSPDKELQFEMMGEAPATDAALLVEVQLLRRNAIKFVTLSTHHDCDVVLLENVLYSSDRDPFLTDKNYHSSWRIALTVWGGNNSMFVSDKSGAMTMDMLDLTLYGTGNIQVELAALKTNSSFDVSAGGSGDVRAFVDDLRADVDISVGYKSAKGNVCISPPAVNNVNVTRFSGPEAQASYPGKESSTFPCEKLALPRRVPASRQSGVGSSTPAPTPSATSSASSLNGALLLFTTSGVVLSSMLLALS